MRSAETVSRAMTRPPIAAWIAILKSWRGISSFSRSQSAAAALGLAAVDDHGQRVDRLVVDQDIHHHQIALAVVVELIVEAGIAAADRFQPVVEIEHHLVQRQAIDQHRAAADIGQLDLLAAALLAELQDPAQMLVGHQDRRLDPRLLDMVDPHRVGHVGRVVQLRIAPLVRWMR